MEIINKLPLFDFLKSVFTHGGDYGALTRKCKEEHCFMFYRMAAIKHPVYMHELRTCTPEIIDAFHKKVKRGTPYPKWLYTKTMEGGAKKSREFPKELINELMLREGIDLKSVEHLLKNHPDAITPVLEGIDRAMKGEAPKAVKNSTKTAPKTSAIKMTPAAVQKTPAAASKTPAPKPTTAAAKTASKTQKTMQKKFGF